MTVQELLNVLNNKQEVPRPEDAELFFYFTKDDGETIDIELKSIGAFSISTDITFKFVEEGK